MGMTGRITKRITKRITGQMTGGIRPTGDDRGERYSQRQFKVGEEIRHILARILLRGDMHDPSVTGAEVTLSEVVVSADFSHARVYFTPLGKQNADETLAGLVRIQPSLQHQLSKQLTTKRCPKLKFLLDTRFDAASRIDGLIAKNRASLPSDQ